MEPPASRPAPAPDAPASPDGPSPEALLDGQLVRRTLAGERAAFDQLVLRHQKQAVSVAYSLLSNPDDAREVVQDAFLKVYLNLASLQRPEAFVSFLLRSVSNLSLNFRRGRRLRRNAGLDESWVTGDTNPADIDATRGVRSDYSIHSTRPGRTLEDKELAERRRAAMEQLPEKQRLAIELFAVQGLPQKEVAETLECSIEAVKWYVFQGRKTLKQLLKDVL